MRNPRHIVPILFAFFVFLAACGGGGDEGGGGAADHGSDAAPAAEPTAPAPGPSGAAGATGSASVSGSVRFEGAAPNLRPIRMDADPGCAKKHTEDVMPEVLVLGDGDTLGNVIVRVSAGAPVGGYPAPEEAVTLDQHGCQYLPHVTALMTGQPFKILNSDGLLHNVHGLPEKNSSFNRAMPAAVKEADYTFDREEIFKIKCDVHPWMGAWVGVFANPFFDVTAPDGGFEIAGLPAGTYTIEAWHERLGTQTTEVTVGDGESASADFVFTTPN